MSKIIFATRPSKLARWQTNHVIELLQSKWDSLTCEEIVITTKGDKILDRPLPEIGGKGLFTQELEEALYKNRVDAAVHSLKDLPTDNPPNLIIGAIPERVAVNDVLISPKGYTLDTLPKGALVGTSSLRRQSQLLAYRPDLQTKSIRGNIDTRIRKVQECQYDAIILAAAGVIRLGLTENITEHIPFEIMLPAPGQGSLAIQCREDDDETIKLLGALENHNSRQTINAERAFLATLGGGCSIPVGAYAQIQDNLCHLQVVVGSPDGKQILQFNGSNTDPKALGEALAQEAIGEGALEILHG